MEPQKLVRSGAERDPLDGSPNNVSVDQYENFVLNSDEEVLLCVDFLLNGDAQIILGLSFDKRDFSVNFIFVGVLIESPNEYL